MKKVKIVFCFVLFLVISFSGMVFAEESSIQIGECQVKNLYVRQGPGTEYAVIETIEELEKVKILTQLQEWYVVQTQEGKVGCIKREYITPTKEVNANVSLTELTRRRKIHIRLDQ